MLSDHAALTNYFTAQTKKLRPREVAKWSAGFPLTFNRKEEPILNIAPALKTKKNLFSK